MEVQCLWLLWIYRAVLDDITQHFFFMLRMSICELLHIMTCSSCSKGQGLPNLLSCTTEGFVYGSILLPLYYLWLAGSESNVVSLPTLAGTTVGCVCRMVGDCLSLPLYFCCQCIYSTAKSRLGGVRQPLRPRLYECFRTKVYIWL